MEIADIDKIVNELKELHLIEPNRKVIVDPKMYCNANAFDSIKFDPIALSFMSEGGFIWLLLHEEAHLIFHQKRHNVILVRSGSKIVIYLILIILSMIFITYLIPKNSNPIGAIQILVIVIVIASIIFWFGNYLENHVIYPRFSSRINKPYWDDEFRCDEYGIMGLLLIRPNLIAWEEACSSLESFKKCVERRGKQGLLKKLIGQSYPHPPNDMRVYQMKILYENFKAKNVSNAHE